MQIPIILYFLPRILQSSEQRVFLKLCLICVDGKERTWKNCKDTFVVKMDSTGRKCVFQHVAELDKNYWDYALPNNTTEDGCMCALEDKSKYQEASFEKYLSKLYPGCKASWRRPRNSFDQKMMNGTTIYFLARTLSSKIMAKTSITARLSQTYTDHCIHATSITAHNQARIEARHICRISAYKLTNH